MTLTVSVYRRLFWNTCPTLCPALGLSLRGRTFVGGGSWKAAAVNGLTLGLLLWAGTACSNRDAAESGATQALCASSRSAEGPGSPACDAGGQDPEAELPACGDSTYEEEAVSPSSGAHTEQAQTYDGKPPAGGPHSGCWGAWGVHATPLAPERFVHNLEHGGIVLTYSCPQGCENELAWLQEFALTHELVVLTEYPNLTSQFGISAWNARAYSDCLSADFVRDFYERRVDRAPEQFGRPPPGPPASCL